MSILSDLRRRSRHGNDFMNHISDVGDSGVVGGNRRYGGVEHGWDGFHAGGDPTQPSKDGVVGFQQIEGGAFYVVVDLVWRLPRRHKFGCNFLRTKPRQEMKSAFMKRHDDG